MSAFIVDKSHIDALIAVGWLGPRERTISPGNGWHTLRWWSVANVRGLSPADLHLYRRELDHLTEDRTGAMLVAEVVASVRYRYPDSGDDLPGPITHYWTEPYSYTQPRSVPTAVEALKLLSCYEYQACEHPEWETSEARQFCEALRHACIAVLPGYDAAPWEWTEESAASGGLGSYPGRPAPPRARRRRMSTMIEIVEFGQDRTYPDGDRCECDPSSGAPRCHVDPGRCSGSVLVLLRRADAAGECIHPSPGEATRFCGSCARAQVERWIAAIAGRRAVDA